MMIVLYTRGRREVVSIIDFAVEGSSRREMIIV